MHEIPNSSILRQLYDLNYFEEQSTHVIMLQTDGAPLVELVYKSLWSVQTTFAEITPTVRDPDDDMMVLKS